MHRQILITGSNPNTLFYLRTILGQAGHMVETIPLDAPPTQPFTIAIVDARSPAGLRRLRSLQGRAVLMALVDTREPLAKDIAREAGADRVFTDPVIPIETLATMIPIAAAGVGRPMDPPLSNLIGRAPILCELLNRIESYARANSTILIAGETGTGKELIAQALHQLSPRREGPFVALNCAAIPESLVESELFGHNRGAFTGAASNHCGRLGAAEGGTLFLDEIGELPQQIQPKLLRVLQEREYTPVGDTRVRKSDVRVIAATNRDLELEVSRGYFRADLYWRLETITVGLPPLRERIEDVLPLCYHVIDRTNHTHQRRVTGLRPGVERMLLSHSWPGNVRELENTVERAVILREEGLLSEEDIILRKPKTDLLGGVRLPADGLDLTEATFALELLLIDQALVKTHGNQSAAAKLLNINRTTLIQKLRRRGGGQ